MVLPRPSRLQASERGAYRASAALYELEARKTQPYVVRNWPEHMWPRKQPTVCAPDSDGLRGRFDPFGFDPFALPQFAAANFEGQVRIVSIPAKNALLSFVLVAPFLALPRSRRRVKDPAADNNRSSD
jgi:hypothetical protein